MNVKSEFKIGDEVLLVRFNGTVEAPLETYKEEDFWKLVGKTGKIMNATPPPFINQDRVLVKFNVDLDLLDLPNHNELPNSLWIWISDLTKAIVIK